MSKRLIFFSLLLIAASAKLYCQQFEIPYTDIDLGCSFRTDSNKIIINDRSEFYRLTNCTRSKIDFSRSSVIAVNGSIDGCETPKVDFRVTKDVCNKIYFIEAIVYQFGVCRRVNVYRRTICIDRLEDDYSVEFEIRQVNISLNN